VDLSVGAAMYLTAVTVALWLGNASVGVCLLGSVLVGAAFGLLNGALIVRQPIPPFLITLATGFVARGVGLWLSSTQMMFASAGVARLGRTKLGFISAPLLLAGAALLLAWLLLHRTPLGPNLRSVGADRDRARRAGVPIEAATRAAYGLCGALAGLGGFISLSQTSSASAAFGEKAEFLAIAAAVLGGTRLSGGQGSVWAPVIGALLITTVQNGLATVNANPYLYPVMTGMVIFAATLLDSGRSGSLRRRV